MQGVQEVRQTIQRPVTDTPENKIDLTAYKKLFLRVADHYSKGTFVIDERNRAIVYSLFLYFLKQPGSLDIQKGLWICRSGRYREIYADVYFQQVHANFTKGVPSVCV